MQGQYSLRSPAVKRLMKEAQELNEPTEQYYAQPLEDNLFEWHFTIRGPQDSEFDGGIYHGRIILPPEYPMKPPNIVLLTPNGRFETFKKICLSISGYHPESWQPSWSIRTALLAIIGFMPTHGNGAIGSLDYTPEERKKLARKSQDYKCEVCGSVRDVLPELTEKSKETEKEAKQLASQMSFHGEKEKTASVSSDDSKTPVPAEEEQNSTLDQSHVSEADQPTNPPTNDSSNTPNGALGQTNENERSANQDEGSGSVRQRNIQRTSSTSSSGTSATVARQPQASGGTGSLALIILLTFAIGLLLFRRLYMTGNLSLPRL